MTSQAVLHARNLTSRFTWVTIVRMHSRALTYAVIAIVCAAHGAGCDVCDGDAAIDSARIFDQADLDDLKDVECILGDLDIGDDAGGAPIESPLDTSVVAELAIIEGGLNVVNTTQLASLAFPSLLFVGRRGIERDGEQVRGDLFVQANAGLTSLDLPDLTDVGGCVVIADNPLLPADEPEDLFGCGSAPERAPWVLESACGSTT